MNRGLKIAKEKYIPSDHDKMIVFLSAAHASIFNTPCQAFFCLNQRVKRFLRHLQVFTSKPFWQTYI